MEGKHVCPKCGAKYDYPSKLERHLNRKYSCVRKEGVKCLRCKKSFAHKSSLADHQKVCKSHPHDNLELAEKLNQVLDKCNTNSDLK